MCTNDSGSSGGGEYYGGGRDTWAVVTRQIRRDARASTQIPNCVAKLCRGWRKGSNGPVGHLFVLHLSAWMHPRANIMARAELQMSAPRARVRMIEKPGGAGGAG